MKYFVNYIFLADIVRVIHYGVSIFIIGAWYLPYKECWYCNIVMVPTAFLQWQITNNKCVLTMLEYKLRTNKEYDCHKNNGFIEGIFLQYCNNKNADKCKKLVNSLLYIVPTISWGLCAYNLYTLY